MKNKKKTTNKDIINLEDTSEIKLDEKDFEKEEKTNKKRKKETVKKENDLKGEKETIEEKREKVKKEIKLTEEDKIIKENKMKRSKLNIFLLIVCLLTVILYSINAYLKIDLTNTLEIVKNIGFILILLIVILMMFKVNNKKCTPYLLILTIILIIYFVFSISYAKETNIYVPDFINKSITEVIEFTERNNLELIQLYEYSDTIPKNNIIMQEYGINTKISDIKSFTVTISDGPNYDKEIIVSNLTGFMYDDVMKYIKENFLNNVEIEFVKSDIPKDTVISQVGSGSLKRNSKILITFSLGNEEMESVSVKDLTNLSLFEATSYLKRYNINYELEYDYSDKTEKGNVIKQSVVNEIVTDKLVLTISLGKKITIPNLKAMKTEDIVKWALENKIKLEKLEIYDKETPLGSVIEVSHSENDNIDEGETLTLTISKGSMVMPKVTNLSEFKLWANENNINYEEVYEFSDTIKNGEIIKVSPEANTKITENDTVVITISKGKSTTIPNLVGLSKSSIQSKCQSANLTCTFTYGGYTESTNKDISLKQSKKSGTVVSEGTNVTITLSSGIYEKVSVPSFVGKSKQEITNSCNSLGIKCDFTYNNTYSNEDKDIAIKQDKTGSLIKGSTVSITLSIGPAKTYTIIIDGSLLSLGNPEQTKKTLQSKLENACPGVKFNFSFKAVNSGIGYLNPDSQVKVGSNSFVQGKTYNVIINSSN